MKFGFMAKHRGGWPADVLCGAPGVSRSGFLRVAGAAGECAVTDRCRDTRDDPRELSAGRRAGCRPCVWAGAGRAADAIGCAPGAPEKARAGERRWGAGAACGGSNVLDRQFRATPNQKWVADFTYSWTSEGWLFVAAVLDLLSCRVVGWSMHAAMTTQLVTDALLMAIWRRGGKPGTDALLHHSDQCSPYTSESFRRLHHDLGVTCRTSPVLTTPGTTRAAPMCSISSNASTIPPGGTRRSATSAPSRSSKRWR